MSDWKGQFERCLEIGIANVELLDHLDEILSWYSSRLGSGQDLLIKNLEQQYGQREFGRRFEEFLDRLIISNEAGYNRLFSSHLTDAQAKQRYRKLMAIFHPDRGVNEQAWLNFRAEKVNSGYAGYKLSGVESIGPVNRPSSATNKAPIQQKPVKARRFRNDVKEYNWRSHFAEPDILQKRFVAGITIICVLLVLSFIASVFLDG